MGSAMLHVWSKCEANYSYEACFIGLWSMLQVWSMFTWIMLHMKHFCFMHEACFTGLMKHASKLWSVLHEAYEACFIIMKHAFCFYFMTTMRHHIYAYLHFSFHRQKITLISNKTNLSLHKSESAHLLC